MDTSNANKIKKLREKAEISRHIHGELERKRRWQGRALYAAVQIVGVVVATAAGAYFRVTGGGSIGASVLGEALLWMVMILPAVGTTLVILDATVLRLRDQEEGHKKGVELWGDWIRRTGETIEGDRIRENENETVRKIEKRYRKCMKEIPNVSLSGKQFIRYKRDWIEKKNESMRLDQEKEWKTHKDSSFRVQDND